MKSAGKTVNTGAFGQDSEIGQISRLLSPAQVVGVMLDVANESASVRVAASRLSDSLRSFGGKTCEAVLAATKAGLGKLSVVLGSHLVLTATPSSTSSSTNHNGSSFGLISSGSVDGYMGAARDLIKAAAAASKSASGNPSSANNTLQQQKSIIGAGGNAVRDESSSSSTATIPALSPSSSSSSSSSSSRPFSHSSHRGVAGSMVESGVWARVCDHIIRMEPGALSINGLDAALETVSVIAIAGGGGASSTSAGPSDEHKREGERGASVLTGSGRIFNDELIQAVIGLCKKRVLTGVKKWPEDLGGGTAALAKILSRVVDVLKVPFQPGGGPRMDLERAKFAEHRGPWALVSNLGFLGGSAAPPEILVETLVILSHLARIARDPSLAKRLPRPHYIEESLHEAELYSSLRDLLSHEYESVRAKACNLLGNLCRNSRFFYPHIKEHKLVPPLIRCCSDSNAAVRTFAVVAIGNLGFHGADLYKDLEEAVGVLEENLHDKPSAKMRANAAGALGNLVRNGGHLVKMLVEKGVVESLLKIALNDSSVDARRISLFSLGNIVKFEMGRQEALNPRLRFVDLLSAMARASSDSRTQRNFERIKRILQQKPYSDDVTR
eukprot:jgi/Bigna1/126266/aug1.2_g974